MSDVDVTRHANFYRAIFGEDPSADNILAVLGLAVSDIERYRDAFVAAHDSYNYTPFEHGPLLCVVTRTGGDNREGCDDARLTSHPWYVFDEDDYWDKTYANYYFDARRA